LITDTEQTEISQLDLKRIAMVIHDIGLATEYAEPSITFCALLALQAHTIRTVFPEEVSADFEARTLVFAEDYQATSAAESTGRACEWIDNLARAFGAGLVAMTPVPSQMAVLCALDRLIGLSALFLHGPPGARAWEKLREDWVHQWGMAPEQQTEAAWN
jgi:hypothetical protein